MPRPDPLDADQLARVASELPRWEVDGDRLRRSFRFADFSEAWAFMARVALLAEKLDHHPDWSNSWNRVDVALSTHDRGGVTELDVALASGIDRLVGPDAAS